MEGLTSRASVYSLGASLAIRTLAIGSVDVMVMGGVAGRYVGVGGDGAEVGGAAWGWTSGFGIERPFGGAHWSLDFAHFTEHSPASSRMGADMPPPGRWGDNKVSLSLRLPWGR